MKKPPCVSFEHLAEEAREATDVEAWVRANLARNSAKTILKYCKVLSQRGDRALARQIARLQTVQERVVPESRQLDDGTHARAEIPDGCVGRGDYKRLLVALGIGEID